MTKRILHWVAKHLLMSAVIAAAVAALVLLFTFITTGHFSPIHTFTANFIVGGIIICVGIFSIPYSPLSTQGGLKYFRHTRMGAEPDFHTGKAHAAHRTNGDVGRAAKFIFAGLCIVAIAGLAQYVIG